MLPQRDLDLGGCDRLAAGADRGVRAAGDRDEAVGVELREVAGAVPAVDERSGGGLRILEVPVEEERAGDLELAGRRQPPRP